MNIKNCYIDESDIMFDKNLKRSDWECMSLSEVICVDVWYDESLYGAHVIAAIEGDSADLLKKLRWIKMKKAATLKTLIKMCGTRFIKKRISLPKLQVCFFFYVSGISLYDTIIISEY